MGILQINIQTITHPLAQGLIVFVMLRDFATVDDLKNEKLKGCVCE